MPRKAKASAPRTRREYDVDNAILTITHKDKSEREYNFNGLRADVFTKLAMISAGDILSKSDNPMLAWEKINQNLFGRERNYKRVSKTVKALANVEKMTLEQAIKHYKGLSKAERDEVKARSDIKKELLMMQIIELEEKPTATPTG
tara:strand:- start:342 stop:779 length:438 start_codon:yes stop_codon:yes gene_type:complete